MRGSKLSRCLQILVNDDIEGSLNLTIRNKVLSKLGYDKVTNIEETVANILETTSYFQSLIYNSNQRHEFVKALARHADFKYYPQGAIVYHEEESITQFSVIVGGKALSYMPKTSEELKTTRNTFIRRDVIQAYADFITENLYAKVAEIPQPNKNTQTGSGPSKEVPAGVESDSPVHQEEDKKKLAEIMEIITGPNDILTTSELRVNDLSFEEKLLLLADFRNAESYISQGDFDVKADEYIEKGGVLGEVGILMHGASDRMVVAVEDLCVVSFNKEDYSKAYRKAADADFQEKLEYLEELLPGLSKNSKAKLVYYIHEKKIDKGEILYKEGDIADGFYMLKCGEIELISPKKRSMVLQVSPKGEVHTPKASKITVSRIQKGTIFGDDDIINNTKRPANAIARVNNTSLYFMKKTAYRVIERHLPHVFNILKDKLGIKNYWREERQLVPQKAPIKTLQVEKPYEPAVIKPSKFSEKPKEADRSVSPPEKHFVQSLLHGMSEEERTKQYHLRMKSSLNLKYPLALNPKFGNDALATTLYQDLRLKKAYPLFSNPEALKGSTSERKLEKHQIDIKKQQQSKPTGDYKSRLFVHNQDILRQSNKALFLNEIKPPKKVPSFNLNLNNRSPSPALDRLLKEKSKSNRASPVMRQFEVFENEKSNSKNENSFSLAAIQPDQPVMIKSYATNQTPRGSPALDILNKMEAKASENERSNSRNENSFSLLGTQLDQHSLTKSYASNKTPRNKRVLDILSRIDPKTPEKSIFKRMNDQTDNSVCFSHRAQDHSRIHHRTASLGCPTLPPIRRNILGGANPLPSQIDAWTVEKNFDDYLESN